VAILNAYTDNPDKGNQVAFLVGSCFAILGAIIAYFGLEDVDKHLDDEDGKWKAYLAENGWQANWGDNESRDPSGLFKHALTRTS
jgi:hypothetical protein